LIDKEKVVTNGTLEASACVDGLDIEIEQVRFADINNDNTPCQFILRNECHKDNVLYERDAINPANALGVGSKLSFAWTAEVKMKEAYLKGSVSTNLGIVSVKWHPVPLELPTGTALNGNGEFALVHGPLKLATSSSCCFLGPSCYIENAPFEVKMNKLPDVIQVAVPFELSYCITNKTSLDQDVDIQLRDFDYVKDSNSEYLVGGPTNNRKCLAPNESHSFSFMIVPTKVGQVFLPQISLASRRFNTWIMHETPERQSLHCVLP